VVAEHNPLDATEIYEDAITRGKGRMVLVVENIQAGNALVVSLGNMIRLC